MMDALNAARAAFAAVPGIASCEVGIEANVSPDAWPLIRIVPRRVVPGASYGGRSIETWVYFGTQTSESRGGLPAVYEALATMEADILEALRAIGGTYTETITDEDRLKPYKQMVISCVLPEPAAANVCCVMTAVAPLSLALEADTPASLAPFTATIQETSPDDWAPNLSEGAVERLLNGATQTRTRITISGEVEGPDGAELRIGLYADGALVGNRLLVGLTGLGAPIAFELGATYVATAGVVLSAQVSASVEDGFTFSDLRLEAQGI